MDALDALIKTPSGKALCVSSQLCLGINAQIELSIGQTQVNADYATLKAAAWNCILITVQRHLKTLKIIPDTST